MTIEQTEVILAAFKRKIAKHKAILAKLARAWKGGDLYARVSMGAEEDRIAVWQHAAAIALLVKFI